MSVSAPAPIPALSAAASVALPHLHRVLKRVMTRLRIRRSLMGGANGLLIGAAVSGAAAVLLRLNLYDEDVLPDAAFLLPPLAGLLAGAVGGLFRRTSPFDAARLIEQRWDLKERFSSALLLAAHTEDAFSLRQRADAETHAAKIDPVRTVPLAPLPRRAGAAFAATGAAFLIWLLPTLPVFQSPAVRADQTLVRKEGDRLVRIAKTMESVAKGKKLDATKKAASQVARLGARMQAGRMPRRKALVKMAALTAQIKQAQQSLAVQSGDPNGLGVGKSLPTAARELRKALDAARKSELSGAFNKGEANGKNTASADGSNKLSDAALQAAQKALSENNAPSLAEQLQKLADSVGRGEPKDAAARQALANKLAALSQSLKGTRLESAAANLADAAKALRSGNSEKAADNLREAARKASEAGTKSEDSQALSQMAQALQGSPDGNGTEQEVSAAQMAQGAGGENAADAFGAEGGKKGGKAGGGAGELGQNGKADGMGKGPGNGIGSGAGKPGGARSVEKATAYADARTGPSGNKNLNRKMQQTPVTSDKGFRLTVPTGNTTKISGKRGEKGREMVSYTQGAPDRATASVPYYQVYEKYAPTAEKALSREDIPASYKKQVRGYFDALRPAHEK